jgi:hypothetical protein
MPDKNYLPGIRIEESMGQCLFIQERQIMKMITNTISAATFKMIIVFIEIAPFFNLSMNG